jgi:rhodanese-related sulfurtransferase
MERKANMVVVLLLALTLAAMAAAGSAVTNVTVGKAHFVILDVRTPEEFAEGHIDGAVNLDIQSQDFKKGLGALDRSKSYLVYCRTGNRSRQAIIAMATMGFRSIFHMNEGIVKWKQQNLPLTHP